MSDAVAICNFCRKPVVGAEIHAHRCMCVLCDHRTGEHDGRGCCVADCLCRLPPKIARNEFVGELCSRAEAAESRVRDLEAACAAMREAMVRARVECREIGYVLDDLCEVCDRTVPGADNYDPKNACADNCNGAMARAAAGMLDAALSTDAGRDYAERMRLAEGLIRGLLERAEVVRDHGCGACVPGGPIVAEGFLCVRHRAEAWLNGAASKERP